MEDVLTNVGPEFFHHVEDSIHSNLRSPFLASLGPGAFLARVIQPGNSCARAIACNLGEIEGFATRICPGYKESTDRIACALDHAAMRASVIAWIFMRCIRHDELSKVVAHGLIGKRVPEITRVTSPALMEFRRLVFRLACPCHEP